MILISDLRHKKSDIFLIYLGIKKLDNSFQRGSCRFSASSIFPVSWDFLSLLIYSMRHWPESARLDSQPGRLQKAAPFWPHGPDFYR